MNNICHITTVHNRNDVRIFHKECKSLSKKYDVSLIVADGNGDEIIDNIKIIDIGLRQSSRIKRARIDSKKAFEKALELDCDLYHFHDPELIKIGEKLKKHGKKVVYDTHEDLPRQIMGKPYLNKFVKPVISKLVEWQENKAARKFDYICTATPFIRERFKKINTNSIDINNYPIIEKDILKVNFNDKDNEICYIGGISEYRGVFELIESLKYCKIKLNLAGDFETEEYKHKCEASEGWKYVDFHGFVDREQVYSILSKSKIGMVTLYPLINYLDSLPIKMFEYMLAGIPVIASNFKFWQSILSENKCGVTADPLNPKDISDKIIRTLNADNIAEMGKNGQKAVLEKYNWSIEEQKLFNVYSKILK